MTETIIVDDLEILLTKKNIKNIYLRVYPPDGRINLSVPLNITDNEIIVFIKGKKEWILKSTQKMKKKKINFVDWTEKEIKGAKIYFDKSIPYYIKKWEKIMNVKVDSWYTRRMKTRWGSCNINRRRICVNLSLYRKEEIYLEYIIVHEMIHLKERYHNKRFYYYMDYYLPNWKELKKELQST